MSSGELFRLKGYFPSCWYVDFLLYSPWYAILRVTIFLGHPILFSYSGITFDSSHLGMPFLVCGLLTWLPTTCYTLSDNFSGTPYTFQLFWNNFWLKPPRNAIFGMWASYLIPLDMPYLGWQFFWDTLYFSVILE